MSTTMTNAASWCTYQTTSVACADANGTMFAAGGGLRIVDRSTFCSGDIVA